MLNDSALAGLTERDLFEWLLRWGRNGGPVSAARGQGDECAVPFDHLYYVLLPIPGLPRELYVKLGLVDDEACPEVAVVSCHLATFP